MKCIVSYCTNNSKKRDGIKYHSIPKNAILRKKWLRAIRRHDMLNNEEQGLARILVCSDHFNKSDYYIAGEKRMLEKNVIPSRFSWPEISLEEENTLLKVQQQIIEAQLNSSEDLEQKVVFLNTENDKLKQQLEKMEVKVQQSREKDLNIENDKLKQQLEKMQVKLQQSRERDELKSNRNRTLMRALNRKTHNKLYSISVLKDDDKRMLFYTGIPNYGLFLALLKILLPSKQVIYMFNFTTMCNGDIVTQKNSPTSNLTEKDQLLMVLMILRRGIAVQMASDMFGLTQKTGQHILNSWINLMYQRFGTLNIWPPRDKLIDNAPDAIKEEYANVVGSIDCIEFFFRKPPSSVDQSQCCHTTMKSLVMTDRNGCIIYCSPLMTGSMSDREILAEGGFLNKIKEKIASGHLLPEDTILAGNNGFTIGDLFEDTEIQINIPTFRMAGCQDAEEELAAGGIAKKQIYIERAISRLKRFKILNEVIPVSFVGLKNQIYVICCMLSGIDQIHIFVEEYLKDFETNI